MPPGANPFPLGRKVQHDPRSRNFPAPTAPTVKSVKHRRYGRVLDQKNVGACTGFALAQALNTKPLRRVGRVLRNRDGLGLYTMATVLDQWEGTYPPDDTGSSGLAVCKAGVKMGYLTGYQHAFGFDQYTAALMLNPVIIGIPWYESFFNPDPAGFLAISGDVVGGHEIEILGYNAPYGYSWALNSWSDGWGLKGLFRIPDPVMRRLLHEEGDVTVPISAG